jgi:hypothetical protein
MPVNSRPSTPKAKTPCSKCPPAPVKAKPIKTVFDHRFNPDVIKQLF